MFGHNRLYFAYFELLLVCSSKLALTLRKLASNSGSVPFTQVYTTSIGTGEHSLQQQMHSNPKILPFNYGITSIGTLTPNTTESKNIDGVIADRSGQSMSGLRVR